jgi:hypothetical protein
MASQPIESYQQQQQEKQQRNAALDQNADFQKWVREHPGYSRPRSFQDPWRPQRDKYDAYLYYLHKLNNPDMFRMVNY